MERLNSNQQACEESLVGDLDRIDGRDSSPWPAVRVAVLATAGSRKGVWRDRATPAFDVFGWRSSFSLPVCLFSCVFLCHSYHIHTHALSLFLPPLFFLVDHNSFRVPFVADTICRADSVWGVTVKYDLRAGRDLRLEWINLLVVSVCLFIVTWALAGLGWALAEVGLGRGGTLHSMHQRMKKKPHAASSARPTTQVSLDFPACAWE